jgi:hypothetical protein
MESVGTKQLTSRVRGAEKSTVMNFELPPYHKTWAKVRPFLNNAVTFICLKKDQDSISTAAERK